MTITWNPFSASQAGVPSTGMLPAWENTCKPTVLLLENAGGHFLTILFSLGTMLTYVLLHVLLCYRHNAEPSYFCKGSISFLHLWHFPCSFIWFFSTFSLFPKLPCSIPLLKLPLYYILEMGKVIMVGRLNPNILMHFSKNVFAVFWKLNKCKIMLYFQITVIMFFSLATADSSGDPPGPNITDAEASFIIYTFLDKKMLLCKCN